MTGLYKKRQGRIFAGVLAGLADKFGWDVTLVRVLYAIFTYLIGFGLFLYVLLAVLLPYKEDEERDQYGTGPRRRKDAEVVDDDDKWFW
ncbi:membrane protein [Streptococcus criceti]|uniref:PspC domain protein n=1 Tax=Streptococcus criceti HS-6 TaxID=873449 RepID=G5JT45_STRCG|nr:PspC domain-containing protein [Streptococcus criceti]EHI75039.1 PspC domain protein [Streptococcus criceti HS-6]SUN37591.1 membrane protein [Streptococcus criceti]